MTKYYFNLQRFLFRGAPLAFVIHHSLFIIRYSHGFITFIANEIQNYFRHKLDPCLNGILPGFKMAWPFLAGRDY